MELTVDVETSKGSTNWVVKKSRQRARFGQCIIAAQNVAPEVLSEKHRTDCGMDFTCGTLLKSRKEDFAVGTA